MSHFKHSTSGTYRKLCLSAALTPLIFAGFGVLPLLTSSSAEAAFSNSQSLSNQSREVYKVHFNDNGLNAVNARFDTRLDWRNPERTLTFDIPDSHWIDSIELMIAGSPYGNMGQHTPVFVKFNNSKIIPLNPQGHGFDARLKLNSGQLRPGKNQIRFTIPKPPGYNCMSETHGAWDINVKNSFLVVKTRRKKRDYHMQDLKDILEHPDFAPKSVTLIAKGDNTLKFQALAAQAIALRTPNIPEFRIGKRNADLQLVIATRSDLNGLVTDPSILKSRGPRIYMHAGRSARLVITGDTEADVLKMVQAFGNYNIPSTRRNMVGLGEFTLQDSFAAKKHTLAKRTSLYALGKTTFADSWGPSPQMFNFDVNDRMGSEGLLTLPLIRTNDVSPTSRVTVRLNGKAIATERLDKTKTTITTRFDAGDILPMNNKLTVEPMLTPSTSGECDYQNLVPGIFIGDTAHFEMTNAVPSSVTELSRFAANGAPFSTNLGRDTIIALTSNSQVDLAASLKVLGHLARVSGTSWSDAEFVTLGNRSLSKSNTQKHVLAIGPKTRSIAPLLAGAPKSLTAGLSGKNMTQTHNIQTAEIARYANQNSDAVFSQYAARQSNTGGRQINRGGVVGLYAAPNQTGILNGIISSTPGGSFSSAATNLVKMENWNALSGSVARWNKSDMMLVQIAQPVAGFDAPELLDTGYGDGFLLAGLEEKWSRFTGHLSASASNFATTLSNKFEGSKRQYAERKVDISTAIIAQPKSLAEPVNGYSKNYAVTAVHKPYIRPEPRSLVQQPERNIIKSANVQNVALSVPALRGKIDAKLGEFESSINQSKRKVNKSGADFSFAREWRNFKYNSSVNISVLKARFNNNIPNQTRHSVSRWTEQLTAQPGFLFIAFFILSFVLLGLVSPAAKFNRYP